MASKGDYLIRGVQGEYYPCKPDIFAATYEAVNQPKTEEHVYKCSVCLRTVTSESQFALSDLYCHRLPMIMRKETCKEGIK